MLLYHYESRQAAALLETNGFRVARAGARIPLGGIRAGAATDPDDALELPLNTPVDRLEVN
jgi:hypothetical protein